MIVLQKPVFVLDCQSLWAALHYLHSRHDLLLHTPGHLVVLAVLLIPQQVQSSTQTWLNLQEKELSWSMVIIDWLLQPTHSRWYALCSRGEYWHSPVILFSSWSTSPSVELSVAFFPILPFQSTCSKTCTRCMFMLESTYLWTD
jgi:hypothetical protein